jgi:hypothetical protein
MASRASTRVLFVYGIDGDATPDPASTVALPEVFDYGRFTPHLEAAGRLLPRVRMRELLRGDVLGTREGTALPGFATLAVLLLATPRGDTVLLLDGVISGEPEAEDVIGMLATTCFNRTDLTLEGEPLLDRVNRRFGGPARLRFGRDVHQMVSPGGALLDAALGSGGSEGVPPVVADLVYRGTLRSGRGLVVRTPRVLNNPGHTAVVHSRGVSVVAGWGEAVENALSTGAVLLVSALGVLRRARHQAFDALSLDEQAMLLSTSDARTLVSLLSAQLNELQLDLSFGVEAYIDSLVIPEVVVESFLVSLREGMGLTDALGNTSRMLDRLQSVINTRVSALTAAAQEQEEQRQKVISLVIAAGSLIALPPTLLLAFFGANALEVDENSSILDLGRYWPAYLLAWLPFVVLVTAGFLPLRRLRSDSAQLRIHSRWSRGWLRHAEPDDTPPRGRQRRPHGPGRLGSAKPSQESTIRLPAPRGGPSLDDPGNQRANGRESS